MPDFRRGKEHIAKANEQAQGGGDFRAFIQNIYWSEDGQSHYLLILNPIEDIAMVKLQKVFAEGRPHHLIARTDKAIGETKDPMEEQWDYEPKDNNICVAVSLVPTIEKIKNRNRPSGFEVETRTFNRKVRGDDGELTEEREEVTTPVVGFIAQSPNNFFNHLASADANIAPINETPIRITRTGEKLETDYEVECFADKPIDLSGLLDFVDGITYLNDEMDELLGQIEEADDDIDAAACIGSLLLDKKLDEMCDEDYYNEVLGKIDEPARFSKKRKEAASTTTSRPARQSQQRSRREPEPQTAAEATPDTDEPDDEPKAKPKRSRRVTKSDSPRAKMDEIRKRSEAKAA
jgi:hypothetical protein